MDRARRKQSLLNEADKEFPDEAALLNQRAKVLSHAERFEESLTLYKTVLDEKKLPDIEATFSCRSAGIAAAKLLDWKEAERLFLLGAKLTESSNVQRLMEIGFKADAAFAMWKQDKHEECLLLLADVLDTLNTIPLTDDPNNRRIHATVRHCIAWINLDSRGEHQHDLVEPIPGMCSNPEAEEGFKDLQIVDLSAVWGLLSTTETALGINIGIKARAQAATGGKSPLIMKFNERIAEFEAILKSDSIDNLIPKMIGMFEAMDCASRARAESEDGWAIGDIPKLPVKYWIDSSHQESICHFILTACVNYTAYYPKNDLPIEGWRSDLSNNNALSDKVSHFLCVLNGDEPDSSLYQQAAKALYSLRKDNPAPAGVWKCYFRLLNVFCKESRWVARALEKLAADQWSHAVANQRFAFSSPSLVCPEIEKCVSDTSVVGLAKVASILIASASALQIRLSPEAFVNGQLE